MDKRETQGVLALLRAAYPNFYKGQTKEDLLAVVNLWQIQFAEFDGKEVLNAVHALISVRPEGYPPSIGAVKEQMAKLAAPHQLSEAEAWALVSRAARNGAYGYRQEFERLPQEVQKVVGRPEQLKAWALMDAEEVESVIASNFMRAFRASAAREKEEHALPEFVRAALPELKQLHERNDRDGEQILLQ